jgi:prophage maintenance system killer protein
MTARLDVRALLDLHAGLVRRYGGAGEALDLARLSDALGAAESASPLADRAASLLLSLCGTRAFADGNRRLAAAAAAYFLLRDGAMLLAPAEDLERIVRRAARGESTHDEVAEWLEANLFWPQPPPPKQTRLRLPEAAPASP